MALSYFNHEGFNILSPALKEHLSELGEVVDYEKGNLVLDYGLHVDFMSFVVLHARRKACHHGRKGVSQSKVKMASELGTSIEIVSRLLKNLENKGVLTQHKEGVHLLG